MFPNITKSIPIAIPINKPSVNNISKKWNLIIKYENIFKNLINILDENMKKTVQLNEL